MGHESPLLKVSEVAPLLGVTSGRVYQLVAQGVLPSVRVGGGIRIPRMAWREWLREQSQQALAATSRARSAGADH